MPMSTNELAGIPAEAVASGRPAARSSSAGWLPTFLPTNPRMPCVLRNDITFSNLLRTVPLVPQESSEFEKI